MAMYYGEDTEENVQYDKSVLKYDQETGTWTKISEVPHSEMGDLYLLENDIMVTAYGWDEPFSSILRYDGTVIQTCDCPLSDTQTNVSVLPLISTEEYVIFYLRPIGGGMDSIILVPLDPEEELQVLCS